LAASMLKSLLSGSSIPTEPNLNFIPLITSWHGPP
jgi:hypothetical protein